MRYSIKPKKAQAWYEKPIVFTVRIKKSTLIILLLIGYIVWPHLVGAQSIPKEAGVKIEATQTKQKELQPYKPSKPIKKVEPKYVAPKPKVQYEPIKSSCGDPKSCIYDRESGNNPNATNAIGCYGIGQDCNGIVKKLCGANYACQDKYFSNYAMAYGGWAESWKFWNCIGSCYSARINKTIIKTATWW